MADVFTAGVDIKDIKKEVKEIKKEVKDKEVPQISAYEHAARARWYLAIQAIRANPEVINQIPSQSNQKYSILHQAAWWGAPDIVIKILLLYGADLKMVSKDGTPAKIAQERKHEDTFILLDQFMKGEQKLEKENEIEKQFEELYLTTGLTNPFAARQIQMKNGIDNEEYRSFCTLTPGDACCGGDYVWGHCYNQSEKEGKSFLQKRSISLDDAKDLCIEFWKTFTSAKYFGQRIISGSPDFYELVIKSYSSPNMGLFTIINWNLRQNEWWNIQYKLAVLVYVLKSVCEGWYDKVFNNGKFKPYYGTVYRGMELRKCTREQISNLKIGDVFYFGGFTSCSKRLQLAEFSAEARKRNDGNDRLLVLEIKVSKSHVPCAVDISDHSDVKEEDEVLLTCFTGFKLVSKTESKEGKIHLKLKTCAPYILTREERKIRETLSDSATSGEFDKVIKLIKQHQKAYPNLVNSTRPSSSKFWTPLHQAAYHRNHRAVEQLLKLGADRSLRTQDGKTYEMLLRE